MEPPPSLASAMGTIPAATAIPGTPTLPPAVPGIAAGAPKLGFRHRLQAEFRRSRAPQKHQPGVAGTAHEFRIPGRYIGAQGPAAIAAGMAGLLLGQVFQQYRHAGKGPVLRETLFQGFGELRMTYRVEFAIHPDRKSVV